MGLEMWEHYGIDVTPYLDLEAWRDHRNWIVHSRQDCGERVSPTGTSNGPIRTERSHTLCRQCYRYTLPRPVADETSEWGGWLLEQVMDLRRKAHAVGASSKGFREVCKATRILTRVQDTPWGPTQAAELAQDVAEARGPDAAERQVDRLLGDWERSGRDGILRIEPAHLEHVIDVLDQSAVTALATWWRPSPLDGALVVVAPEEIVSHLHTLIRTSYHGRGRAVTAAPLQDGDTPEIVETALGLYDLRSARLGTMRAALETARAACG